MSLLTLRQLEAEFKKHRPSNSQLEAFYAQREEAVAALRQKSVVTVDDLIPLDRIGRFQVVDELWRKCDQDARHSLLHDEHHFVRSAATMAGDWKVPNKSNNRPKP